MDWIHVDDEWPNVDCDIKLTDGSIIKGTTPQSDGDFYWRMPYYGDVFVCEFSVTHWRKAKKRPEQ